ncbi:MAG: hypothetical protein Q7J29_07500 [Stagnimonas sp.]|nr:hypothetical protein [Stagnimonas sp.]
MKTFYPLVSVFALSLALSACNKPEAPTKTEADVMRATAEGQAKVNEAAAEAVTEHLENAADAVEDGKALTTADKKDDVDNLHTVDTTLADANYKVAKEKCDALTGDAKSGCLKNADTIHEIELGKAKADQEAAKKALADAPK